MSHGRQRSAGTLTLKHKFSGKIIHTQPDPHGHYMFMVVSYINQIFLIGNVYGCNNTKKNMELFETLNSIIDALLEKFSDRKIILGGDFNVTVNDDVDRWPSRHKENPLMIDFMNERGVIDV